MDKTCRTEFHRSFLIETLPEPLTRASAHIQIFDNFITETRLRLRSVRNPENKEWTHVLRQSFPADGNDLSTVKVVEMHLNEAEYAQLKIFEGNEIRKNRYFHDFDNRSFSFDVYLGGLWGLNTSRIEFSSRNDLDLFEPPPFAVFEITHNRFFQGANLVGASFENVRAEVAKIGTTMPMTSEMPDE